jgi:hypothetical protein
MLQATMEMLEVMEPYASATEIQAAYYHEVQTKDAAFAQTHLTTHRLANTNTIAYQWA